MRVIITGATGFIGRNLAEDLHSRGTEVIATGRSRDVGRKLTDAGMTFVPADLVDAHQVMSAFDSADCVIHCAGKSADWGSPEEFFDVNVVGTRNVMRTCENHGINRILFMSTPSLYFTGQDRFDIAESDRLPERQLTHYGRTKLLAERELMDWGEANRRVSILRPRAVLGPYDNTILPRILSLSQKKSFPLINGGQALTDITYIDNLIDIVRSCLTAGDGVWNQVYNVSNGEPIRIRDWFGSVLAALERPFRPRKVPENTALLVARFSELASRLPFGPRKPSLTRFSVGYMAKSMTMSIEKAREMLDYEPRVSNQEGFERLAKWARGDGIGTAT